MSHENPGSADLWLERNLRDGEVSGVANMLQSPAYSFLLRLLPAFLVIAALVVAAMWYQEGRLGVLTPADRIGYPLLLAVTAFGALWLRLRPGSLTGVIAAVFAAYLIHLLAVYYSEMANRLLHGSRSEYELTILALWLPLGYVGSFVFLSPRIAVRASLAIYAAIALPQLVLLANETDPVDRQIALAILISQPLYISALWGVRLLKAHATSVRDLANSMREAASMDLLTGVANRRAMRHALETATRRLASYERPLSLMLFDVDRFKSINDTHGHAVGDEVLVALAQRTRAHLRSDLLGRWGGEEFMILTLDQDGEQAVQIADRLRAELAAGSYPQVGTVTVSIGVTSYIPGESVDDFINRADVALYQAKERGRNRVEGLFGASS